jgi:carbamate kinase
MTRTALIAIGGNALVLEDEPGSVVRQQERARSFAREVVALVADGWHVLVTHGNGPQVGFILRRGELVADRAAGEGLPDLPLWLAVADSQGGIGHMLAVAIDSELEARGLPGRAVAVLTHAEVDRDDPGFATPTKPIGSTMRPERARQRAAEAGWAIAETAPGRFRRVVASPAPRRIVEADQIAALLRGGSLVIAAGGGGVPVVRDADGLHPVDAVVDKDRASCVLAAAVGVDVLALVTGVDHVFADFGTPRQRALRGVTADEVRALLRAGQFPAGSMGPKVESALQFLDGGGNHVIVTSLSALREAFSGRTGTHIVAGPGRSGTESRSVTMPGRGGPR